MNVGTVQNISFQRRFHSSKEEAEYCDVLKRAKKTAGNEGKSVLIIPASSLPQRASENTGVGNLASKDSMEFFDFAKKYWGINEIQLLPIGQYHEYMGMFPLYSGTSTDIGNSMIDIKSFVSEEDFKKIVKSNSVKDRVNFKNVVNPDSIQEEILRKLYDTMPADMEKEFANYKSCNLSRLKAKSLFRALRKIYGTSDYRTWSDVDKNLFNPNIVNSAVREKRISEILSAEGKEADFYLFEQYLGDKSLEKAKNALNLKGLKLNGDVPFGFSFDEVWSHPEAFKEGLKTDWGQPCLNYEHLEAEKLLREKINFYAKRFDGMRIDASWHYTVEKIVDDNNNVISRKNITEKVLDIIDDEIKKVKGDKYNPKDIMHEFIASPQDFSMYSGFKIKPFADKRVKLVTSEYLSEDWGSNHIFLQRGWKGENFVIGVTNHDSAKITVDGKQAELLAEILKLPRKNLSDLKEFRKAKYAEIAGAYNNMLFFTDALGMDESFLNNSNPKRDYTARVTENYETKYLNALEHGGGYNPMDALQKYFKANGLDKKDPKLYKKIVKFNKILTEKEGKKKTPLIYTAVIAVCGVLLFGLYKYISQRNSKSRQADYSSR